MMERVQDLDATYFQAEEQGRTGIAPRGRRT
jgi:hypothetical protein